MVAPSFVMVTSPTLSTSILSSLINSARRLWRFLYCTGRDIPYGPQRRFQYVRDGRAGHDLV